MDRGARARPRRPRRRPRRGDAGDDVRDPARHGRPHARPVRERGLDHRDHGTRAQAKLRSGQVTVATAHVPCTAATPDCRFWDWGESNLRPDCCTEHLLELIDFTHALLAEHGIVHWLEFGTLLGAVRDGTLIPWDWDADFGILARDADALLALRVEIEAAGHSMHLEEPGAVRIYYSETNQISIDLWKWYERGELLVSEDEN